MIPFFTIVGRSGSGKTTLIEKLLPELISRGYRVGTIKHHIHDFEIDQPGKDSWRHFKAGAETVIIASPHQIALVKKTAHEIPLEKLCETYVDDVDLILAEGYKQGNYPKIEIFRSEAHDTPLFLEDERLLAIVTDIRLALGKIPRFGLDEIEQLGDFIEGRFLANLALPSPTSFSE